MAEVKIKEHTRRGKNGKTIRVHGYSRRVGKKGVRSPKREMKKDSGEELQLLVQNKQNAQPTEVNPQKPRLSPKDIALQREVTESMKRSDKERESLGMSREQYSRYKMRELQGKRQGKKPDRVVTSSNKPAYRKKGILERVEDTLSKFVDKYGNGRKYR